MPAYCIQFSIFLSFGPLGPVALKTIKVLKIFDIALKKSSASILALHIYIYNLINQ